MGRCGGKRSVKPVQDTVPRGGIGTPHAVMMPTCLTGEVRVRRTAVKGSSPQSGRTSRTANP